jgi:hypothetical protein
MIPPLCHIPAQSRKIKLLFGFFELQPLVF